MAIAFSMKNTSFILSIYHITNGRIKNIRTVIELSML